MIYKSTILALLVILFSGTKAAIANEINELSGVKRATDSGEYETLKNIYRECNITKGKLFMQVSTIEAAIQYAPKACARELLSIRQFLLSGAFKIEVIDQLVESVRIGVEIDLVNAVYNEALKKQGIKQ